MVHLGERECSIQRRHQKLVEEAPSVVLTDRQRRKLGRMVVDAARAVGYQNAGTFEFLMDERERFYFLEANTRLQVEHPITEMVTGVDIVKEQIQIASGEPLSFRQEDVAMTGHAIECRINANRPTLTTKPGRHPGVQYAGWSRYPHRYGRPHRQHHHPVLRFARGQVDRPRARPRRAIARMQRALEMTVIEGIETTLPLHRRILEDPDFIAGRLSTAFMDRYNGA